LWVAAAGGLAVTLMAGAFALLSPPVREALLDSLGWGTRATIAGAVLLGAGLALSVFTLTNLEIRRRSRLYVARALSEAYATIGKVPETERAQTVRKKWTSRLLDRRKTETLEAQTPPSVIQDNTAKTGGA
jgi:hypothetical protein